MAKPKSFDTWTPEKQEEWREKKRQRERKWRAANREKVAKINRKYSNQKAADQFFIMAGAAEQLSKLKPNQPDQ
jgi:Ethanolamine utilization protein EutJ (predicted chaperonin)